MTKLTEHFELREFELSATAIAMGIDNAIPESILPNIKRLAEQLERVRDLFPGKSVRINSGYRCVQLNHAVGGVPTSYHTRGLAADIVIPGVSPLDVCRAIAASDIDFDKAIEEGGAWTHFQIPETGNAGRRETLTAHFDDAGNATYTKGLA